MTRPKKANQRRSANGAPLGFEEKLWQAADKLRGHWREIEGIGPRTYSRVSTHYLQEGITIPPVKIYKRGRLDQELADFILADPPLNMSDCGRDLLREDKGRPYGAPPARKTAITWKGLAE